VNSAVEKQVGFVDSSLCTARWALWNGSASAEMLVPFLERMDDAGFAAVDILDPESAALAVQQDESPWRLLRYAATRLKKTPANVWISARCLLGTVPLGPDLLQFGIATLAKCGVRRVTCFDALNDVGAIESIVQICRRNEIDVAAALVHMHSPRHDDRYYAERARSLSSCPIQSIAVVDLAGSLGPIATRTLISAVRNAALSTPIEFKSHCRSGVAEQCCFEAVSSGASILHTCTETLAGGWSLPPTGYFVEHLSRRHIALRVDPSILAEMNEYVLALAQAHDLPLGRHVLPDASAERFQMPVALLRQSAAAAEKIGVSNENLLEECVAVQKDLGSPTLAHPIGAMVIAQAILNLANAKRFASIAPEVVAYVRGDNGVPPGPLNAELRARVARMPQLPRSVQATGSWKQDSDVRDHEQRLLSAWFPNQDVTRVNQSPLDPVRARTPEQYLKEQIERYPALQSIRVRKGEFFFELNRNTE
jgi:oxaloacetate decarboxylase alpha subunit